MTRDALPAGTRLHNGALLVEELLKCEEKCFVYRAYDVPSRREIALLEFFPDGASRHELAVAPPTGWSTPGFLLARNKFAENRHLTNTREVLFSFEENDTIYIAEEYSANTSSSASANTHATVPLPPIDTPAINSHGTPLPPPYPAHEEIDSPKVPAQTNPIRTRPKFSWRDIIPDAIRGALQGAVAGTIGGVLLGAFASLIGDGDIFSGTLRGVWALPIGALAGALLGALRALPSSAPQLATASARTQGQQLQSTLSGTGKGALLGFFLGGGFLVFAISSGMDLSLFVLLRAIVLFALCGAFSGAIVGFIRVVPRDRSRR